MLKTCGIHYQRDDYRVALLNPYIVGADYSAFFYAAERQFHYGNADFGTDRQQNCKEWSKAVDGLANYTDVYAFLYGASYDDLLALQNGVNTKYVDNTFAQVLERETYRDLLTYVVWAKSYEAYSLHAQNDPWSFSPWRTDEAPYKEPRLARLRQQAETAYQNSKDPFLQQRYAYQLIVMGRYALDSNKVTALYLKHFASDNSSVLAGWANFHRSFFIKDAVEQAYQYALLFHQLPEKAVYAKQQFDLKLLPQVLEKAKNEQERAAILTLAEIHHPGRSLDKIRYIHSLNSRQKLLGLLLVREINKLEDWLLTPDLTGNEPAVYSYAKQEEDRYTIGKRRNFREKNRAKDEAYLLEVLAFVKALEHNNTSALDLLQIRLMLSHLYSLSGDVSAAQHILQKTGPVLGKVEQEQLLTEQLLLLVQGEAADLADPHVQNQLASLLYQLAALLPQRRHGRRDLDAIHLLLAEAYQSIDHPVFSYLFANYAWFFPVRENWSYGSAYYQLIRPLDWQANLASIDVILAFIDKENKTPLEQYVFGAPLPDRNAILDLRGTIALRDNQLDEALASFAQVEQHFWQECYAFSNNLQDDPFSYPPLIDSTAAFPATKTAYVKRLIALEAAALTENADSLLLLGLAWFNNTFHGNSWMMYSYGRSSTEMAYYRYNTYSSPSSTKHYKNYYRSERAEAYLKRALESSNSIELRAKAAFLIAKINEYRTLEDFYAKDYRQRNDSILIQLIRENYQDWGPAYTNTQAYAKLYAVCPRLSAYWGKNE